MRGRKPKPTALKVLEGNRGRRPLNDQEPKPELGALEMPKNFRAKARECWERIVPELVRSCGLAKIDFATAEAYCNLYADMSTIQRALKRNSRPLVETPFGPKKNPLFAMAKDAAAQISKLAGDLGLNSSARSRIKVPQQKPIDPFEEYQRRRQLIHGVTQRKGRKG